jgi:tetratricopeptide (TPR) repeat protein
VYAKLAQYEQARACFERALSLAQILNDEHSEAGSLNNLGNLFMTLGEYEQAATYFRKSIEINTNLENKFGLIETFVSMGKCIARLSIEAQKLSS